MLKLEFRFDHFHKIQGLNAFPPISISTLNNLLKKTSFRPPAVKYPGKMSQKSKTSFLSLKMEDPASNAGIISIYKVLYSTPTIKFNFDHICQLLGVCAIYSNH